MSFSAIVFEHIHTTLACLAQQYNMTSGWTILASSLAIYNQLVLVLLLDILTFFM